MILKINLVNTLQDQYLASVLAPNEIDENYWDLPDSYEWETEYGHRIYFCRLKDQIIVELVPEVFASTRLRESGLYKIVKSESILDGTV